MASEPSARYRQLPWLVAGTVRAMAILLILVGAAYALDIQVYLGLALYRQQFLGLVLALSLAIVFLTVPASPRLSRRHLPWYDGVMATLGMICGLYVAVWYPRVADFIQFPSPDKYILGTAAVLLVLEASRRLYGPVLVVITLFFVFHTLWADHFPMILRSRGIPWAVLSGQLFLNTDAILGPAMEILATVVLVYMLFGALMFAAGGGSLLTDLATALMGRFRGGPAKACVVASCMFGSISGSAVANVAVTGTVTIPLMKQLGYRPALAGGIEATSATGGIVMPPIMGAISFIMAEYLQIPYRDVVIAAIIPAFLYYGALLVQVDLEAGRLGMKGLPADLVPRMGSVLRRSWPFLLPLPVIIVTLLVLYWSPSKSGMAGVFATALVVLVCTRNRGPRWWARVLADAGASVAEIALIGALVGIIIGCTDLTGLGFSLSMALLKIGQGSLLLFLVTTAVISLILGMGLPGIAIYIMQTALIVPALTEMGVKPLVAHFFIMYFGTFSMITPPVALAAMAAAGIARADPWETGWEAVKLGVIAYLVPFMFVFSPTLLAQGRFSLIVLDTVTAGIGVLMIGVGLRGFFFSPERAWGRSLLLLCSIALLLPVGTFSTSWLLNVAGFVLGSGILAANFCRRPQRPAAVAVAG